MTGNSYQTLLALVSCLNGSIPKDINWDEVIDFANRSLTISSLAAAIRKLPASDNIPGDVCDYLSVLYERNAERNLRLLAQLKEAVCSLNRTGIQPVVMKGAAVLLAQGPEEIGARILADLDILVHPADIPVAVKALESIGYEMQFGGASGSWPGNPNFHLPAVLARPTDVGSIDLQCRPRGPASFSDIQWLYDNSRWMALDGGSVHVPSSFAQIIYLILHDQFQDGDYWRGLMDLRHLLDISTIARGSEIDWYALRLLFGAGYERNAADTQILTVGKLFEIREIERMSFGRLPHLQFARRRIQLERQFLRFPFTLLTLLTEISHYSSWDRFGGEPYPDRWQEAERKIRELRRVFRPRPLGKL
ncbi:hypothetical protein CO661_02170 [Sinorhizobium fredii]|uniref:Nucleotidyltransferase family protein n=1 Tax=Rhizobium fredii TaxID=380 RepID=A0A2A6M7B1_RHIFR|nr:nucleotidyltransferase family protein [Sinorhizobium fredii]PDT50450.1 hypothetical protein CO661_02170 [Sinorhizobium fredii]